MSRMGTTPVFKCRGCGRHAVYVTLVQTTVDDPEGKLLERIMQGLPDIALCKECRARYNYFASRNRADEFHKSFFNPEGVLYNVREGVSEVDWYGRNSN